MAQSKARKFVRSPANADQLTRDCNLHLGGTTGRSSLRLSPDRLRAQSRPAARMLKKQLASIFTKPLYATACSAEIVYVAKNGLQWKNAPEGYGLSWTLYSERYDRGSRLRQRTVSRGAGLARDKALYSEHKKPEEAAG